MNYWRYFTVYESNFEFKLYIYEPEINHCACPVQKDIRLKSEQYFSNPHNMWSNGDHIKNLLSAQIVIVTISIPESTERGFCLAIEMIKSNKRWKYNTSWVHLSLSNKFLLIRVASKILQGWIHVCLLRISAILLLCTLLKLLFSTGYKIEEISLSEV